MDIHIEHNPSPAKLDVIGVYDWQVWKKEVSTFPWTYKRKETCYIIRGEATITPDDGESFKLKRGDLLTFPAGFSATWEITKDIQKHYIIE
ncbi:MAG: cupin domain-containing protein [Methylococcales bacterium]|jgi:uncharacterized protein|nr:cupin domain-containing protein [Methylococcales bacterium]